MRGRQPVETELLGLKVTSQPLPFAQAHPLIPEVGLIITLVVRELGTAIAGGIKGTDDVVKLLPALVPVVEHFGQGRLERLAPKLLASTTVIMPDQSGELSRYELIKEKERNAVFDDYPECYLPIVYFAGRVTYSRFFPAAALRALAEKAKDDSAKSDSSLST